jgi:hypothetical protein
MRVKFTGEYFRLAKEYLKSMHETEVEEDRDDSYEMTTDKLVRDRLDSQGKLFRYLLTPNSP